MWLWKYKFLFSSYYNNWTFCLLFPNIISKISFCCSPFIIILYLESISSNWWLNSSLLSMCILLWRSYGSDCISTSSSTSFTSSSTPYTFWFSCSIGISKNDNFSTVLYISWPLFFISSNFSFCSFLAPLSILIRFSRPLIASFSFCKFMSSIMTFGLKQDSI